MDMTSRERNRLMRVIHNARDAHPGMLLEPSDLGVISNLAEKLEKLKSLGLINLRYADGAVFSLSLTDAGFVYFETRSDERWRFIRRSILVPIGVSLVTTFLIWWIAKQHTGNWQGITEIPQSAITVQEQ